jgi:diamine N-acetyltransferase
MATASTVRADRARSPEVALREIDGSTVRAICDLEVAASQRGLVAPNAVSIAEAHFEPAAWFRAIHADDVPVGFAMIYDPTRALAPESPDIAYLWRFMIAAGHQSRGYGEAALRLLIAHVRTLAGVTRFRTSYVPAPGNAGPLYERVGFRATGEVDDGEIVMELPLAS